MDEHELERKRKQKEAAVILAQALASTEFDSSVEAMPLDLAFELVKSLARASFDEFENYMQAGNPKGDTFGDLLAWCAERNEGEGEDILNLDDASAAAQYLAEQSAAAQYMRDKEERARAEPELSPIDALYVEVADEAEADKDADEAADRAADEGMIDREEEQVIRAEDARMNAAPDDSEDH